jgi:hypothetical protein
MKLVVNHHHPCNGLAGSVNHSSSNSLGRIRGPPGRAETNFRAHISILFSESERLACKNSSSLGHREKLRRMKHRDLIKVYARVKSWLIWVLVIRAIEIPKKLADALRSMRDGTSLWYLPKNGCFRPKNGGSLNPTYLKHPWLKHRPWRHDFLGSLDHQPWIPGRGIQEPQYGPNRSLVSR